MLGATARSLQHILQPDKRLRDGRYKKKLHLLVNLKNVRVLAPLMLFNSELRRKCQPLTYRPEHSVKRERRNVRTVVLRVRGGRMTRMQE